MALMPLIIIVIRMVNRQRFGTVGRGFPVDSATYGSGLLLIGGMIYVFLILAGLSSNLFAFEEGGMRTLILSPVDRRKILLGKNIVLTLIALVFATALLILNFILFRDTTPGNLLFLALTFVIFAAISSTDRQLAFNSFSQAHEVWKTFECVGCRRTFSDSRWSCC